MQNQKGFILPIVIAAVVVALLGAGGFYAYKYYSTPTPSAQNQPIVGGDRDAHGCIGSAGYSWCEAKQKCLRTWEEPCEADTTAGWKTYTNSQYGFSFKYPKEWVISENGSGPTVSVWSSEKKKQESVNAIIPIYPEFSVNYKDLASFKDFAKSLVGKDVSGVKDFVSSYGYFGSYADININGQKGYAVVSVANRAVYTLYVESNGGVYVLGTEDLSEGSYDPKNPKIDENVKKIISTFKFTK